MWKYHKRARGPNWYEKSWCHNETKTTGYFWKNCHMDRNRTFVRLSYNYVTELHREGFHWKNIKSYKEVKFRFFSSFKIFVLKSAKFETMSRYETNKDSDTIQLIFMFIFVVGFTIFGKCKILIKIIFHMQHFLTVENLSKRYFRKGQN